MIYVMSADSVIVMIAAFSFEIPHVNFILSIDTPAVYRLFTNIPCLPIFFIFLSKTSHICKGLYVIIT